MLLDELDAESMTVCKEGPRYISVALPLENLK